MNWITKNKVSILRAVICAILLCGVAACMLIFQSQGMDAIAQKLEDINPNTENDMQNALWLIEQISYFLPVVVMILAQMIIYRFAKRTHPSVKQKEQGYEMIIAMVFVYAVMLPYAFSYSEIHPAVADPITGTMSLTLIEQTLEWFVRQSIFFLIAIMYRFARADALKDVVLDDDNEEKMQEDIQAE